MRILIADDSEVARLVLAEMVEEWGYETVFAKNGLEAWEILNRPDAPKLALVDWIMPEMDGLTLCEKLKESPDLPFTYVVLVTSKTDKEDVISALNAGADDFLTKPPEPEELQSRLAVGVRILGYQDEITKQNTQLCEVLHKQAQYNIKLEEARRHKDQFMSLMSHELRTPLNGIIGFTDLLHGQFFGLLNEKQLKYVELIEKSGNHLLSLINDLLDVSKIDAGKMSLVRETIDTKEFIQDVVDLMNPQFEGKQLKVSTSIEDTLESFLGDPRKCKQIMLNLLSNALKYTRTKGDIRIEVFKENEHAKFIISDTGIGIKPEDIGKIFNEFEQADPVRDEALGGTGIGLALTRRLIEMHGGEINVESEHEKGSKFWFTLPLSLPEDQAETNAIEQTALEHSSISRRRILVAEANETSLSLILDLLTTQDHQVVVARNGQEAIDLALANKPELILMDLLMPGMGGLEATQNLRTIPGFSQIPIIALTVLESAQYKEKCFAAGYTDYLTKPVQADKLISTLNRHLKNQ